MNALLAQPLSAGRFTLDGSEGLENHLDLVCQNILLLVRGLVHDRDLEAILLGGGYGRGEGGVMDSPTGQHPYNDLEFYVFIRGPRWLNERRYSGSLHRLGHQIAEQAGLEVEFKIVSFAYLQKSPPSMFYYDLFAGHKWLWGDRKHLQNCAQHFDAANIPLSEATRLLMNRCTGLLFAGEKLRKQPFQESDTDFIGRNLAKVELALGDAVLTALGQYHWSCRVRHDRLCALSPNQSQAWLPALQRHHGAGVEFKLHPHETSDSPHILRGKYEILSALSQKIWLWLESRRLDQNFSTARDYALSPLNKCPETDWKRNVLVNAKTFGLSLGWDRAGRYPRERLFNTLPVLLWEKEIPSYELTRLLQEELRTNASNHHEWVRAYQILSARLNGSTMQPL